MVKQGLVVYVVPAANKGNVLKLGAKIVKFQKFDE